MLTGGDGAAVDPSVQDGIAAYYIELCHYLIMHRIPFNAELKARAAASELWRRITAD